MPHSDLSEEAQKAVLKEALQEWLDAQFARVGRWTITGLCALILTGLVYISVRFGMNH